MVRDGQRSSCGASTRDASCALRIERLKRLLAPELRRFSVQSVLICGSDESAAELVEAVRSVSGSLAVRHCAADELAGQSADLVICAGLLERTPVARIDSLLESLRGVTGRVLLQIRTSPPEDADSACSDATHTVRYADWWRPKLRQYFTDVEVVATSANDVLFKTWRSSPLALSLRMWHRMTMPRETRSERTGRDAPSVSGTEVLAAPRGCLACGTEGPDYLGDKNGYHVWKCGRCQLVFVNPMPTEEEIEAFYSRHPRNDKYMRKSDGKFRRARWRIFRLRRHVPGRRFLDIGCSIGASVEAARQMGFDATGIDLDPQSIQMAAARYPHCRFLQISSSELARRGERFDLIFCTEVIEHVTDPEAFVDELRMLLNPGGILFLTTPHATHVRIPRDILSWYGLKPPEHIVLFGRRSIRALFDRRGLQVLSAPLRWKTTLKVVARRAT